MPALAAALIAADGSAVALPPPAVPPQPGLEIVVVDPEGLLRVRLEVTVGGKPVAAAWDGVFARLVGLYDRDGDGRLDRAEAARLPSPFSLRQLLWGRSAPHTGRPVPWGELDAAGAGRVGAAEVARYYRAAGLSGATLAVGRSAAAAGLSDALFRRLDADDNGVIEPAEWAAAADRLRGLDANGDGLIAASELVPQAAYPDATGVGVLLTPAASDDPPAGEDSPLVLLPDDSADHAWATQLVHRRNRDGDGRLGRAEAELAGDAFARLDRDGDAALTPAELAGWRGLAPDLVWKAEAGAWPDGEAELTGPDGGRSQRLEATAGTTRLLVRGDGSQTPAALAAARVRLREQFADADRGHGVGAADLTKRSQYELQQLLAVADRDADGRLTAAELAAWQAAHEAAAAAHVLVTVHDHGRGLFELLDTTHDGTLSAAELRAAAGRPALPRAAVPSLPRHLLAVVSRGHPRHPVSPPARRGPD